MLEVCYVQRSCCCSRCFETSLQSLLITVVINDVSVCDTTGMKPNRQTLLHWDALGKPSTHTHTHADRNASRNMISLSRALVTLNVIINHKLIVSTIPYTHHIRLHAHPSERFVSYSSAVLVVLIYLLFISLFKWISF